MQNSPSALYLLKIIGLLKSLATKPSLSRKNHLLLFSSNQKHHTQTISKFFQISIADWICKLRFPFNLLFA